MDRSTHDLDLGNAGFDHVRHAYQQTLASWASDVLSHSGRIVWSGCDSQADYQDRDWAGLYSGSVLDD